MTQQEAIKKEVKELKDMAYEKVYGLIHIYSQLEEIGAKREANSLGTIIGKLEAWANK